MGGDRAPEEILKGCWQAAPLLDGDDLILLVGDEKIINTGLESSGVPSDKRKHYQPVATTQVIEMDESPVDAVRTKRDSSISVMSKLVKEGDADVAISAGNTGACVAAAQLYMRTLAGGLRPGISVLLPTFYWPGTIFDVRGKISPPPHHPPQYSDMGAA